MSATNCTLRISPADGPLATCTPNLMPFHIAYSGPAPISTYFRVQPAPLSSFGQNTSDMSSQTTTSPVLDESSSSQSTLVASSSASTSQSSVTTQVSSIVAEDVEMKMEDIQGPSTARRFVSTFRGRVLQGLEVDLPIGYAGVILRAPGDQVNDQKRADDAAVARKRTRSSTKGKGKGKRAAMREESADEEAPDEEGVNSAHVMEDEDIPERVLKPTATFSSFMLWNPDIPVDEGKDEYLRSLSEWTRLATEIHRFEE